MIHKLVVLAVKSSMTAQFPPVKWFTPGMDEDGGKVCSNPRDGRHEGGISVADVLYIKMMVIPEVAVALEFSVGHGHCLGCGYQYH